MEVNGEGSGWGRKEEEGKREGGLDGGGEKQEQSSEGEGVKGTEFTIYVLSKQTK